MKSSENSQSKRKHQRGRGTDRTAVEPSDKQARGGHTPRHASDATRSSNRSDSQIESKRHSRGMR